MTSTPTWFEKRALQVRPAEWAGPAPADAHPAEAADAAALAIAERAAADAAALVPAEALEASEQTLAVRTAELTQAEAELAASREEIATAHAAAADAQQALARVIEKTLEDAEAELVKLAIAIAERVVGRELGTSPELIVDWAREALAASTLGEGLVVAVSSDVAVAVDSSHWEDLAPRVVTDASLPPSTCELRDGATTVTASGGDRLDLVAELVAAIPARAA